MSGTGIVAKAIRLGWGEHTAFSAVMFFGAAGAWTFAFVALARCTRNEVVMARYMIGATRVLLLYLICSQSFQLYLDAAVLDAGKRPAFSFSYLPAVKPVLVIVVSFVTAFLNTHPVFRLQAVACYPVLMALGIASSAALSVEAACGSAGTCVPSRPVAELLVQERLQYADLAAETVVLLSTAFVAMVMGWFSPRYPVKLFSVSSSLAAITHARRGDGRPREIGIGAAGSGSNRRSRAKDIFVFWKHVTKDFVSSWLTPGY